MRHGPYLSRCFLLLAQLFRIVRLELWQRLVDERVRDALVRHLDLADVQHLEELRVVGGYVRQGGEAARDAAAAGRSVHTAGRVVQPAGVAFRRGQPVRGTVLVLLRV